MKCRKCNTPFTAPAASVPTWADPRSMMVATALKVSEYTNTSGVHETLTVAKADPKRVMIGFQRGNGGAWTISVLPDPSRTGWQANEGTVNGWQWFSIFDYGPLVNQEWYAYSAVSTMWVYEVYRLQ